MPALQGNGRNIVHVGEAAYVNARPPFQLAAEPLGEINASNFVLMSMLFFIDYPVGVWHSTKGWYGTARRKATHMENLTLEPEPGSRRSPEHRELPA
jgi:hypothetical protein